MSAIIRTTIGVKDISVDSLFMALQRAFKIRKSTKGLL